MEMDRPISFKTQAVLFEHCNQQSVDTYPVKLRYKEDPFNFKYCLRSEFWRSTLKLCQNLFTFNDLWYRLFVMRLTRYFFNETQM